MHGGVASLGLPRWPQPCESSCKRRSRRETGRVSTDLYRHFNDRGDLLYVGVSLHVLTRTVQHRQDSHWFEDVTRIEIERHQSEAAAKSAEERAIREERPKFNRVGAHPDDQPPPRNNRLIVPISPSMVDDFDRWWRAQPGIRSRSDAVRHLIQNQLDAEAAANEQSTPAGA